jgi:WD40 repeat protein
VTLYSGGRGSVGSVAFSPDGKLLASTGNSGTVKLWDTSTGKLRNTFRHTPVNPFPGVTMSRVEAFNSQFAYSRGVTFNPAGANLAVGNGDGSVSLWDIDSGAEVVLPLTGVHEYWNASLNCVAFHPSGKMLASTFDAPAVRVWDLASRQVTATLDAGGTTDWSGGLAYLPPGDILVTITGNGNPGATGSDGSLQFWKAPSYTSVTTLARTNTAAYGLAVSPDSKTLAVLGTFEAITLWDVPTRSSRATLAGEASGTTCIAFGPDDLLAAGFGDGNVTIWNTANNKKTTTLSSGSDSALSCVAVSPTGKTIASGGWNLTKRGAK